jgi:hypothetical protein
VQASGYHLTSGNSFIERLQAARHSTLLMCVAASQKPMQSASVLPPPPILLGAASLGLPLADGEPGERARLGEEPPPVANWLGKGGDIGDSGGTVDPGCAVGPGDTGGVIVGKVVVGAESRGLRAGEPPADERACANAASGSSSKRAMATRTGGLGVSIEINHDVAGSTPLTISRDFCGVHNLVNVPRRT